MYTTRQKNGRVNSFSTLKDAFDFSLKNHSVWKITWNIQGNSSPIVNFRLLSLFSENDTPEYDMSTEILYRNEAFEDTIYYNRLFTIDEWIRINNETKQDLETNKPIILEKGYFDRNTNFILNAEKCENYPESINLFSIPMRLE